MVEIPILVRRSAPSACEGALEMLNRLAALVAKDLGFFEGGFVNSANLPADVDVLKTILIEHWQEPSLLPTWLRFTENQPAPTASLRRLADMAWREHSYDRRIVNNASEDVFTDLNTCMGMMLARNPEAENWIIRKWQAELKLTYGDVSLGKIQYQLMWRELIVDANEWDADSTWD